MRGISALQIKKVHGKGIMDSGVRQQMKVTHIIGIAQLHVLSTM